MTALADTACTLCGGSRFQVVYPATLTVDRLLEGVPFAISQHRAGQHLRIVRCRACALVFVNPRLAQGANTELYEDMVDPGYTREREGRLEIARRAVRKLGAPGRLLDIGCAAGYSLQAAREAGWEVEGIDPSRWAVEEAWRTFGIRVRQGPVEGARWDDASFDAVVMADVVEHLSDPRPVLAEVRRLLKPGGVLYLTTPDYNCVWSRVMRNRWWMVIPEHNYYFTRRTLRMLLAEASFRTLSMGSVGRTFTLEYWLQKGSRYFPTLARLLRGVASRWGMLDRSLTVHLGDEIEVLATP